jgi:putative FmdB family regulatory protein
MPLYEYQCQTCGKSFELLRRMRDVDTGVKCPDCDSDEIERQLSTFATAGCGRSSSGRFT